MILKNKNICLHPNSKKYSRLNQDNSKNKKYKIWHNLTIQLIKKIQTVQKTKKILIKRTKKKKGMWRNLKIGNQHESLEIKENKNNRI